MMKRYITTSLAVCLVGYAAGARAMDPAAVVRQPQGKVFISQGSAMALAQDGMPLYAGNRVIAVSGGRAEVAYSDGCVVALPENSLLAVKGADQCRLGQAQVRATSSFQSARIGQAAPSSSSGGTESPIADFKDPKREVDVNGAPVKRNQDAYRDDRIVTGENSEVRVVFRGCVVEMVGPEEFTVKELREQRCKAGVVLTSGGDPNAEIAIIKNPQGVIMVNGGKTQDNIGLKNDSRIIASPGSKVTVVFEACEVVVNQKEDVKVKDLVTKCEGGLWADTGAGGLGGGAGAGIGVGTGIGAGIGTGAIAVGTGLGMSVIGAILHDNKASKD